MRAEWLSDICSDNAPRSCISVPKFEQDESHRIDCSKGKQKCFGTYKKQSHKYLRSWWVSVTHPKINPSNIHAPHQSSRTLGMIVSTPRFRRT